jgi:hypothetical protein
VKRSPGLGLVTALMPSFQTEIKMAKSTQSRKTAATTAQPAKTNSRAASKTLPAAAVAKKKAAVEPLQNAPTQPTSKIEMIVALLRRPKRASI